MKKLTPYSRSLFDHRTMWPFVIGKWLKPMLAGYTLIATQKLRV
jgi:hypothetical protein